MWEEQPVFAVQMHTGGGYAVDASDDQLCVARDARQFFKCGFVGAPERLALGNQPVRRLAYEHIRLRDGFHSGAGDDERHRRRDYRIVGMMKLESRAPFGHRAVTVLSRV